MSEFAGSGNGRGCRKANEGRQCLNIKLKKLIKMFLKSISNELSRDEMGKIMAGSFGASSGRRCAVGRDCTVGVDGSSPIKGECREANVSSSGLYCYCSNGVAPANVCIA